MMMSHKKMYFVFIMLVIAFDRLRCFRRLSKHLLTTLIYAALFANVIILFIPPVAYPAFLYGTPF
jgi:uncharacterized membrane protein